MINLAIIADDFTGACEMAALFGRPHSSVPVWLQECSHQVRGAVSVINTNSRNLSGEAAAERIRVLQRDWSALPRRLYKKIDSTLRGPIGQELEALREAFGLPHVLVAPALPSQGRTTIAGYQLVRGVPLEYTPAARDPHSAVATSHIPTLLRQQAGVAASCVGVAVLDDGPDALLERLRDEFRRHDYCVVDAATDCHIAVIAAAARALLDETIIAGSAGLARHLANALPSPEAWAVTPPALPEPSMVGILVLCGSMNPVNSEQLRRLLDHYSPPPVAMTIAHEGPLDAATLVQHLASAGLILTVPKEARPELDYASAIARCVAQLLAITRPRGILAIGGETAYKTLKALGAVSVLIQGEVVPGLPFGTVKGGKADGARLITKAGGFGEADTLFEVVRHLQHDNTGAWERPAGCKGRIE